ncbi:FAD:protein FMN transferase [Angustibacter peucedani]
MLDVPAPGATSHSWRALGTYAWLATQPADTLPEALGLARRVLDEVDRACSRFRADADLVRANANAGRRTVVSPLLAAAVSVALEAARETDGLVDPTLGHALVAVGYDRDLALLPAAATDPVALPAQARTGGWADVVVDLDGAITVPAGCALDLGATGKAWAADLVAATVADALHVDVVVSLGGDVAVTGSTVWPVAVSEVAPEDGLDTLPGDVEVVLLGAGGLATSTTRARRWVRGGRQRHHLLDPRTGEPTEGRWRTATAAGRSAAAANTASTAAVVLGADAESWLEQRHVAARLVGRDGAVHRTAAWTDREELP